MEFQPIGIVKSAFKEKFGVPRQSGMLTEAKGVLKLNLDRPFKPALNYLETFSHLWILFVFHKNRERDWRPVIDPPREEPVKSLGVFASRSPYRPNPIGLSAVKLERIDYAPKDGIEIHVTGIDILDGTPVLDIKPYLPYADKIDEANAGWTKDNINDYSVHFSPESSRLLEKTPEKRKLIEKMLQQDPRPTSQKRRYPFRKSESNGKQFAFRVLDFDVKWKIQDGAAYVTRLVPLI